MNSVRIAPGLAAAAVAVLVAGTAAAGEKSYKWTDDEGNVHYGDRVPPEHSDKRREVIDDSGMVVETIEPPPDQKELDSAERKARRERRDRMLLDSYSNEDELIRDRARLFEALQKQISLVEQNAREAAAKLEKLEADARERRSSDRPIPDALEAQIEATRATLQENRRARETLRKELDNKRQQFLRDLERYRQLTSDDPDSRAAGD